MQVTLEVALIAGLFALGGTVVGAILNNRMAAKTRREDFEREREKRREDFDRDDARRSSEEVRAEVARVRALYVRVARIGNEYRELSNVSQDTWKAFLAKHVEVRAEFDIDGSEAVRGAFNEYLEGTQGEQIDAEDDPDDGRYWNHFSKRMEKLTRVMREELYAMEGESRALQAARTVRDAAGKGAIAKIRAEEAADLERIRKEMEALETAKGPLFEGLAKMVTPAPNVP